MRILTVVGARPQFVKAAPVSRALRETHEELLVHTGQHYDDELSRIFFEELGIPEPDAHLGLGEAPPGPRLAAMVRGITAEIAQRRPAGVLVYGDTDSTLAGALAAGESGVLLAHVEAGMRSHDLHMPEEVNRIATDHLAALLLCPTESSAEQLRREGASGRVDVVGDVMLDACMALEERARARDVAAEHGVERGAYYACTVHRAANTDEAIRLAGIVRALDSLDLPVLLPCHPRTRDAMSEAGLLHGLDGLRLLPPVSHSEMLALVGSAKALLTDSGGLQKEAYFLGVPCVTLRDETEWVETVASGWNRLAGTSTDSIRAAVAAAVRPDTEPDLERYGGGNASLRVVQALEEAFA